MFNLAPINIWISRFEQELKINLNFIALFEASLQDQDSFFGIYDWYKIKAAAYFQLIHLKLAADENFCILSPHFSSKYLQIPLSNYCLMNFAMSYYLCRRIFHYSLYIAGSLDYVCFFINIHNLVLLRFIVEIEHRLFIKSFG